MKIFSIYVILELEVRSALVGNGNMISICTCLTQLDQSFVQSFGVFLLDHILLIVLRYLSDKPTVNIKKTSFECEISRLFQQFFLFLSQTLQKI